MKDKLNYFARFAQLGYNRLVPVVPPDAPISEGSSLFKRVGTSQDGRGKTPGIRGQNGLWFSFDWVPYEADERDTHRWHTMNAGVGIKTGQGIVAIDADTLNEDYAKIIKQTIDELVGPCPIRIGNYPKALYLIRVAGPVQYQRIDFGENIATPGKPPNYERVEILSDGRFFVAQGIHPKTLQPYNWIKPIIPLDELPQLAPQQITNLLNTLRDRLPAASAVIKEGGTAEVSQASLRGKTETVRKAVATIPNTSALFPSRESYRDMGYAIRAAVENEHDAFEIFADWCDRWVGGDNDPGVVAADWGRMKPPYRRGAQWLYELAETHGAGGEFSIGEVWFDDLENPDNPFAEVAAATKAQEASDVYPLTTIDDLRTRPPAEWLIDRHIPKHSVGFIYSVPGAGKSFLTLDMALAIASGLQEWQGDRIGSPASAVLYLAAEGAYGFRNRVEAWITRNGETEDLAKRFKLLETSVNFMDAESVKKLIRTVQAVVKAEGVKFALTIVDTVSRAMPGADENIQKDMTLFVRACDTVRDATGGAVIGVHHANKNGGEMRGSTVLLGAGDFVFRLERRKGATVGHLTCEKQKDGPDGWDEPYRFDLVNLKDGETSLCVARADMTIGPGATLTPDTAAIVLAAMKAAWDAGEPWTMSHQGKERFAVRRMVADFGFESEAAEETLKVWEGSGLIRTEFVSARDKKKGLKVVGVDEQSVLNEGIFS